MLLIISMPTHTDQMAEPGTVNVTVTILNELKIKYLVYK
jgi:hypothetical protein